MTEDWYLPLSEPYIHTHTHTHMQAGMTEDWYLPLSEKDDAKATAQESSSETAENNGVNISCEAENPKVDDESELVMDGGEVDAFFEAINS